MKRVVPEKELVQRLEKVLELCRDKTVLHLGCTNYPYTKEAIESDMLLHDRLSEVASRVFGIDNDEGSIQILKEHGHNEVFKGDLESLGDVELPQLPDVIIAGEMIEHLNNPGLFLGGIRRFMNAQTKLVITTINAHCALRFFQYGLRGRNGVNEPVHPDHVAYYSYSTLNLLLERHGFEVDRFFFYDLGKEHRPHNRFYWNMINDISVRISPQLSDGIIAVCGVGDNG